uniref:Uncharacterized protein n=1 Tax=Pyramimonas obovata TaxID=1411642 RepID=A0A7S0RDA8_9CHLO|mmetsp:Transcript_3126/g.6515  ORF Transcript_3126/g.6515 Transcript_3126/m.6515 type:complete len:195 (+) Transcript_3126:292-876(+)
MPVIEGMMKVYARDCMAKAVVNLESTDTATFEGLLALNVFLTAGDVVQCALVNVKWGEMALERFLLQKKDTLNDDDVAELGYYSLSFSLAGLKVYTANNIPCAPSIEKFFHAKKELARQAFEVLLSKPLYITVPDVKRLRDLNYVWGRQAFEVLFEEKRKRGTRLTAEDVVLLAEADVKWGRKAQFLSIGRWVD